MQKPLGMGHQTCSGMHGGVVIAYTIQEVVGVRLAPLAAESNSETGLQNRNILRKKKANVKHRWEHRSISPLKLWLSS